MREIYFFKNTNNSVAYSALKIFSYLNSELKNFYLIFDQEYKILSNHIHLYNKFFTVYDSNIVDLLNSNNVTVLDFDDDFRFSNFNNYEDYILAKTATRENILTQNPINIESDLAQKILHEGNQNRYSNVLFFPQNMDLSGEEADLNSFDQIAEEAFNNYLFAKVNLITIRPEDSLDIVDLANLIKNSEMVICNYDVCFQIARDYRVPCFCNLGITKMPQYDPDYVTVFDPWINDKIFLPGSTLSYHYNRAIELNRQIIDYKTVLDSMLKELELSLDKFKIAYVNTNTTGIYRLPI